MSGKRERERMERLGKMCEQWCLFKCMLRTSSEAHGAVNEEALRLLTAVPIASHPGTLPTRYRPGRFEELFIKLPLNH